MSRYQFPSAATTDASLLVSGTLSDARLSANVLLVSGNLAGLANTATARTNLGLAIGTNVQAWDADLDSIAALTTTATGRALLTESTAQTGTGGLVRATSPTLVTPTFNGISSFVSADNSETPFATFYANNLAQGVAIGYGSVGVAGSNSNIDFSMLAKGTGNCWVGGSTVNNGIRMRLLDTNNTIWFGSNSAAITANSGQTIFIGQTSSSTGITVNTTTGNLTASGTVTGSAIDVTTLLKGGVTVGAFVNNSGFARIEAMIAAKYNATAGNSIYCTDSAESTTRVAINRGDDGTILIPSGGTFGWTSTTGDVRLGAVEVGIDRRDSNGVEVNNGTPGTLRDVTVRNIICAVGSAGAPTISFGTNTTSGFFQPATNFVTAVTGAVARAVFGALGNGSNLGVTSSIGLSSEIGSVAPDVNLARVSSGVARLGTTSSLSDGTLQLTNLTASGTVAIGQSARFTEQVYTPTGTTQTIDLNAGNLNTLSLGSTTGNVTLTLTVPTSAASGRIKIIQHGTTARNITIVLSSLTAKWFSVIPTWASQAVGKHTILSYTIDGSFMNFSAVEEV